jgi:hypothetical protein
VQVKFEVEVSYPKIRIHTLGFAKFQRTLRVFSCATGKPNRSNIDVAGWVAVRLDGGVNRIFMNDHGLRRIDTADIQAKYWEYDAPHAGT